MDLDQCQLLFCLTPLQRHILIYNDKVATCPPGSQGACLDIISAYHNSPLFPAHKAYVASMWRDRIYVDHCTMEGLSSAGNIQGSPADALVTIIKSKLFDVVLKWVDDFVFFHVPIPHPLNTHTHTHFQYKYDISSVFAITDPLGVPWHPINAKGQDFSPSVPYVGFLWSLENHTVSLSCKKRI